MTEKEMQKLQNCLVAEIRDAEGNIVDLPEEVITLTAPESDIPEPDYSGMILVKSEYSA